MDTIRATTIPAAMAMAQGRQLSRIIAERRYRPKGPVWGGGARSPRARGEGTKVASVPTSTGGMRTQTMVTPPALSPITRRRFGSIQSMPELT